jgi:hypothetical protein
MGGVVRAITVIDRLPAATMRTRKTGGRLGIGSHRAMIARWPTRLVMREASWR